jgi:hypothetical protein
MSLEQKSMEVIFDCWAVSEEFKPLRVNLEILPKIGEKIVFSRDIFEPEELARWESEYGLECNDQHDNPDFDYESNIPYVGGVEVEVVAIKHHISKEKHWVSICFEFDELFKK